MDLIWVEWRLILFKIEKKKYNRSLQVRIKISSYEILVVYLQSCIPLDNLVASTVPNVYRVMSSSDLSYHIIRWYSER